MALALVGVRADQGDDEEERDGNQEVNSAARDEAHSRRRRRGPDFLHEPECVGSSSLGAAGGAEGLVRTVATHLRENELGRECFTFPDESVSLASRESAPAKITSGRGTRPSCFGLRAALSGR
jgi:hypothetical protein